MALADPVQACQEVHQEITSHPLQRKQGWGSLQFESEEKNRLAGGGPV
jgi:hypothetical protein